MGKLSCLKLVHQLRMIWTKVDPHIYRLNRETKFIPRPAAQLWWHDRLVAKTILKIIPPFIKPNYLTTFRFLATPVVAFLMFREDYLVGLIAFLFVVFTDMLDGSLARVRNQVTEWGKVYDPLADKILIASMVFIIVLRYIDWGTAMLIVGIEAVVVCLAWIRKREGGKVEANIWGKIKMVLQVAGVSVLLLAIIFNWASLVPIASGTLYLAIAFAVVSLLTQGI